MGLKRPLKLEEIRKTNSRTPVEEFNYFLELQVLFEEKALDTTVSDGVRVRKNLVASYEEFFRRPTGRIPERLKYLS